MGTLTEGGGRDFFSRCFRFVSADRVGLGLVALCLLVLVLGVSEWRDEAGSRSGILSSLLALAFPSSNSPRGERD